MHRSVARFSASFGAVAAVVAAVGCGDKINPNVVVVNPVVASTFVQHESRRRCRLDWRRHHRSRIS